MLIMKMSAYSRTCDCSIDANDMDDHANESLLTPNEWPETLMIVAECNWTLEIMQNSLLKVYSCKWMHHGVNEHVFAV